MIDQHTFHRLIQAHLSIDQQYILITSTKSSPFCITSNCSSLFTKYIDNIFAPNDQKNTTKDSSLHIHKHTTHKVTEKISAHHIQGPHSNIGPKRFQVIIHVQQKDKYLKIVHMKLSCSGAFNDGHITNTNNSRHGLTWPRK